MSAVAERKLEALRSRREIYAAELDLDRAWTELRSLTRLSGSPELVDDLDLAGADRPAAAWAEQAARSHPALLAARRRRQAAEQEQGGRGMSVPMTFMRNLASQQPTANSQQPGGATGVAA